MLREDADGARPPSASRSRACAQLNDLLDEARDASGAGTRLILHGPPVPLDPGVELAAYRIVQEALTNARRHAPGAAVDVELHYPATRCAARSATTAPARAPARPGRRARADAACGSGRRRSAAGCAPAPRPAGGFVVEATLPAAVPRRRVTAIDPAVRSWSPTTTRWSAAGSPACSPPSPTSRSSAPPPTAPRRSGSAASCAPDVVLMDVRMPGMDGIEATRRLTVGGRRPRVLILTTFDLDEYVYDAIRAGASGFLLKDVTRGALFDAVRVIAAGEALLAPTRDPAADRRVRPAAPARRRRRPVGARRR